MARINTVPLELCKKNYNSKQWSHYINSPISASKFIIAICGCLRAIWRFWSDEIFVLPSRTVVDLAYF